MPTVRSRIRRDPLHVWPQDSLRLWYKAVVAIQGKTIEKEFHLEKGKANEMTVSLP
jgi:hypothetical protein